MIIKYPEEAFEYVQRLSITSAIKYAIDWRQSRTANTHLVPWIESQVGEAIEKGYLNAVVKEVTHNVKKDDYDTIVINILRWVNRNIRYVSDTQKFGSPEVWEGAESVFKTRTADCEDGGLLIYVLSRLAGVPANRLLLFAGWVKVPGKIQPEGHAYIAYKPSYNPINFVMLDWCYFYDNRACQFREHFFVIGNSIHDSNTNKSHNKYIDIWFAVNEERGYVNLMTRR